MWHRASNIGFALFIVLFLQACVISVPVGGAQDSAQGYEVIIQTHERHLKTLAKEYRSIQWTEIRTLSAQAGMYLIMIFPGNRDPELVISDLRRDARIQQAEWNKPLIRR